MVVANMILVPALGPNPSFLQFFETSIQLGGLLGQGLGLGLGRGVDNKHFLSVFVKTLMAYLPRRLDFSRF